MFNSKQKQLTEPERVFLEPANPTHRQYEALRAYFVEGLPSQEVAMKITCDLPLTLMASSLYRLLGTQIGRGYEAAKGRHIFRDFIDAVGLITLTDDAVIIRYQKRAHNPLLLAAGFANTNVPVPWLGGKRLQLVFG